jgi:hypothetical protein
MQWIDSILVYSDVCMYVCMYELVLSLCMYVCMFELVLRFMYIDIYDYICLYVCMYILLYSWISRRP